MDYWQQVEWHRWPNWAALRQSTAGGRAALVCGIERAAALHGGGLRRRIIWFWPGDGRLAEKALEENRERWLRIPMFNAKARSLNLSNCVALVLFEALRQQGFCGELFDS